METTSWKWKRSHSVDRGEKGEGLRLIFADLYLSAFVCVVVLTCWETPGMFEGLVGCGIRADYCRIEANCFMLVLNSNCTYVSML